jgi:hypothetical protein
MSRRRGRRESILLAVRVVFFSAVLIAAAILEYRVRSALDDPAAYAPPAATTAAASAAPETVGEIETAYSERRSGFMTEADGTVAKILPDDREGSRHQRFVVDLPSGHSVLIAHNIDLAERIPIRRGERVRFRGQYEWNDLGGVVHWTHRDPEGRHDAGWIEYRDERYQ